MSAVRRHRLARVADAGALADVPALEPFVRADGDGRVQQPTTARAAHDGTRLLVRFDCVDRDVWGTYERRDDPIWTEEVVEVFLAPGGDDPVRYFELEVSPRGVLFDALVVNPGRGRAHLRVDPSWDCPGIHWSAVADPALPGWRAELAIPWASLAPAGPLPRIWRANFYRVERPRDGAAEYTCWASTLTDPADFHRPERFGVLEL